MDEAKKDESVYRYDVRGIDNPDARYIATVNPEAISELLSTLESLQRENERITILVSESEAERVRSCSQLMLRAEAAEAEVKRLRDLVARNWSGNFWRSVNPDMADEVRTALVSTGGEHHAE